MVALSNKPVFPQQAFSYEAICVAANTTLTSAPDDTLVLIARADNTDGMVITSLGAIPRMTITALNVYVYETVDDSAKILVASAAMAANTVDTTNVPVMVPIKHMDATDITADKPLILHPDSALWVGISVAFADGVVVRAQGHELLKASAT